MSIVKESKVSNGFTKKLTSEFIKPLTHISTLSPRHKTTKLVIDIDKLTNKKTPSAQYNISPKAEILSARSQLINKPALIDDKINHNLTKLNTDRVKSMSGANLQKSSPRMASRYFLRTPSSVDAQNKVNVNLTPREEPSYNKPQQNLNASPAENFFARFSKLQTTSALPNPEPIHSSKQSHGPIQAFAVCTNQGLVRNYNEDRVSIVINAQKPPHKQYTEQWPNCNFLGVMDGHGGNKCAEFLKDNLHHYILKSKYFPWSPHEALKEACSEADKDFLEIALSSANETEDRRHDRSGSCALVMVTIDDSCYICNIGDSRAVISQNGGASRFALTRDHKPNDKMEQKRIVDAGGSVYQNFPVGANGKRLDSDPSFNILNFQVPHRISPGKLSVSRAFGDIEAKLPKFGGNPNVLISKPEVTTLKLTNEYDFIVLACDGIFDVLSNEEIVETVWSIIKTKKAKTLHEAMKMAVEAIIRDAMLKKSLDNVTAIIVCLSNLGYKPKTSESMKDSRLLLQQKNLKTSQRWEYYQTETDSQRNPTQQYKPSRQYHRIQSGEKNECLTEGNDSFKPTASTPNYGLARNLSLEKLHFNKNLEHDKKDISSRFPVLKTPR